MYLGASPHRAGPASSAGQPWNCCAQLRVRLSEVATATCFGTERSTLSTCSRETRGQTGLWSCCQVSWPPPLQVVRSKWARSTLQPTHRTRVMLCNDDAQPVGQESGQAGQPERVRMRVGTRFHQLQQRACTFSAALPCCCACVMRRMHVCCTFALVCQAHAPDLESCETHQYCQLQAF